MNIERKSAMQCEWLSQHDSGVWTFTRRELKEIHAWYGKRKKHELLADRLLAISNALKSERYKIAINEVLPELIPDEKRNPTALSKIKSVTVRALPTPEGKKRIYHVDDPIFKHFSRRPLQ